MLYIQHKGKDVNVDEIHHGFLSRQDGKYFIEENGKLHEVIKETVVQKVLNQFGNDIPDLYENDNITIYNDVEEEIITGDIKYSNTFLGWVIKNKDVEQQLFPFIGGGNIIKKNN